MEILYDLHTHTNYSHGTSTAEELVCSAIQKGLTRIAITEHGPSHIFYGVRGERLAALRREVDLLASRYANDIDVLFGMECNLTAFGRCDAPAERSMFDVLILAYHKGVWPLDKTTRACALEALHIKRGNAARLSDALLAAAEKYRIDIFSHPCLYAKCDIARLAKGASQLGTLLEINGARVSMSDDEIKTAAQNGARFIIDSDAHSAARVGDVGIALAAAGRCGVDELVVNLK